VNNKSDFRQESEAPQAVSLMARRKGLSQMFASLVFRPARCMYTVKILLQNVCRTDRPRNRYVALEDKVEMFCMVGNGVFARNLRLSLITSRSESGRKRNI